MGFFSSDGERDEDFNSKEGSISHKEDSFDSDFSKQEDRKRENKIKAKKGLIKGKKSKEGMIGS